MRNFIRRIAGFPLKKQDHLSAKSVDDKKGEEIAQSRGSLQIRATNSFPLTFAQQRLWYLDQLVPNSFVHNIPLALHLIGKLDVDALEQSLNEVIRRHGTLRTSFRVEVAQPVQIVTPALRLALSEIDLKALSETEQEERIEHLAVEEMYHDFDLSQSPLLRASLLQLGEERHVLLLIMHHIISDSWSLKVFLRELAILYQSFSNEKAPLLSDLPMQYTDFAVQQRLWLQTEEAEKQLAYWKQQLVGAPAVLQLPTDRPRRAMQSFEGAYYSFQLSQVLTEALKTLSQREGVTLFVTLLAAVNTLLFRYTRQDDVIVGTPIANRTQAELEGLIGFFANTLALRTDLSGDPGFLEVLHRVREVVLAAYAHQYLPFERLVEEVQPKGDLSYHPLFQVLVVMQDDPMDALELPDLTLAPLQVESQRTPFDIAFEFSEMPEGLGGRLMYSTDLFDATTIARLAGHLQTLLEGIVAHPEQGIGELPILTRAEHQQLLVEWNNTTVAYPKDQCVHHLFEAQVQRTPDAVALVYEEQQLTYRELNQRANQLAHYLRRLGVGPEVLVGLFVERSIDMVVGLLGILKAGGAYLPLDVGLPEERFAFMLEDTQVSLVITTQRFAACLPASSVSIVRLDSDWKLFVGESYSNPVSEVQPDNLAYVIYTSGSTGKPKGAMILHRGLVNYLSWCTKAYEAAMGEGAPVHSPLSFDLTVTSLFSPLLVGRRIVLLPEDQGAEALPKALCNGANFSLVKLTPAHVQLLNQSLLPQEAATGARALVIGGEALQAEDLAFWHKHAPHTRLINEYGPTETVVGCCVYEVVPEDPATGAVPIGRPIANTQLYILDAHMHLVPIGVPGELYIGGDGLARGYLNRPELTAERFIGHPFSDVPGACLYKTGDLARYRADGVIEFLGRIDHQVKIRGFRIELGEIETVLSEYSAVQQAVVLAREDTPGDKRLVAYVVLREKQTTTIGDLQNHVVKQLPTYMVPSAFVLLEVFPVTPNGKIDRRALPSPNVTDVVRNGGIVAPNTPTEKRLVAIVAPLLRLEQVGIDDNFFLIGGNSLMGMQLVARVVEVFGIDFPLQTLFNAPTVRQLAAEIERLILVKLQMMGEDEVRYLLEESTAL